MLIRLVLS